ncbi:MAG: hypothetical protein LBG52_03710 [Candidatus Peribacteria bacterium]|nr:hypothetical protein [Candidatus Peribacteria bacterium]
MGSGYEQILNRVGLHRSETQWKRDEHGFDDENLFEYEEVKQRFWSLAKTNIRRFLW